MIGIKVLGQMDQKAKVKQLMVKFSYGSKVRFKGRVFNAFFHLSNSVKKISSIKLVYALC